MTSEEKSAQVGTAVQAYQTAKIECAHIDRKIDAVSQAYRLVGGSMGYQATERQQPQIIDDRISFSSQMCDAALGNLLNTRELTELIKERDRLRGILANAKREMACLGITGIE